MSLTIYLTEDFGTMDKKERFRRRRQVIQSSATHHLEPLDLNSRIGARLAHHALNLPRPAPTFFQKIKNITQLKWYYFRQRLSQLISPKNPPLGVAEGTHKLRQANFVERRKIIEELWQELSEERECSPKSEKVLRIPDSSTEFLVAEPQ